MTKSKQRLPVGRPRSEVSKAAIIRATVHLLETSGYASLTMEGIAVQAKVSKATIYRWWSSKELLILDIFLMMTESIGSIDESDSLRGNIMRHLHGLVYVFNSSVGRTMLSIISENPADSDIVKAFHVHYLIPRREDGRQILSSGIAKGQIKADIDFDVVLDMIYGPLYYRVLIYKKELDDSFIELLMKRAMVGIGFE